MRTSLCGFGLAILVGVGLGLSACGRDKPAPPPVPPVGSAGSGATAPVSADVEIFVNDQSVARVTPAQLATWPRLDTLVPPDARKLGTWERVILTSDKPVAVELGRPSASYPDMVPAVFPGEGGPAFGMFDAVELAHKGKAALREDHIRTIRIQLAQGGARGQNDDGGGAAADPTKLVLTVTTPTGKTTLTGPQLLALPREPAPGNADQKGWRLTAFLEAAGVKQYERLVLGDASGTTLVLDKADVSDTSVPFVKLNKQGALRLRVLKKAGDGWNPGGDLRALTSIIVK